MSNKFGMSGFTRLSKQDPKELVDVVWRHNDEHLGASSVGELFAMYKEHCAFLDAYESRPLGPVSGDARFVERSRDRGFGLLAGVRGYLKMLCVIGETDSLAFCNQDWQDAAASDVTLDPVFVALEKGKIDADQAASALFSGGIVLPHALQPRRFATVFTGLPLFSREPSYAGGKYNNDFPVDFAGVVNRTQLSELAEHLLKDGGLNQDVFTTGNTLQESADADLAVSVNRACQAWRELNPGVTDLSFHLIISDYEMMDDCGALLSDGRIDSGIGSGALHLSLEIADRYDGLGKVWFLVAEPSNGRAAFDVTRFTDVNDGLYHTPTLLVKPTGDGWFEIGVDLRIRIAVREPNWILAVVVT